MASSMARGGRRRRVLNDEVRSASGTNLSAYAGGGDLDPDAPRYGEQAEVEHHPQVTDFVPRRKRAVLLTLLVGGATAAATQTLSHFAEPVAALAPGVSAGDLQQFAGGAAAWTSAVALLFTAMLAKLIYSLRRHRVDDYQGRYRVWRWIAWGGVLASINAVAPVQSLVAKAAAAATGTSLTAGGAEWWLAPLTLLGGWILVRLVLEVNESRSTTALTLLAATCYVLAAAGALGWSPAALGWWGDRPAGALPLAGHTIALAAMMVFARYTVLDVQGLIEHRPRVAASSKKVEKRYAEPTATVKAATAVASSTATPAVATAAVSASAATHDQWSDEVDADGDGEDEVGARKLTKAERKRLRRQNRAA